MFDDVLIHPDTIRHLQRFVERPSHAVLLTGEANNGKRLIAENIAAALLGIPVAKLANAASFRELTSVKSTISVEQVRDLIGYFSKKTVGKNAIKRVVLIPDAENLQRAAANALLKLLEEPPEDSVFILTSSAPHKLLPTIASRVQTIAVLRPSNDATLAHFSKQYTAQAVEDALTVAGRRVGAVHDLLSKESVENELSVAQVKEILGKSLFEQLALIDTRLKDKAAAQEFVSLLLTIASASLRRSAENATDIRQWQRIASAALTADEALAQNANTKLVLTELMLSLRASH